MRGKNEGSEKTQWGGGLEIDTTANSQEGRTENLEESGLEVEKLMGEENIMVWMVDDLM